MSGFAFGSSSGFPGFGFKTSTIKETKSKVLSQEELDKKNKIKQERREAKIILDKIKIEQAIFKSKNSYESSKIYLIEIETFYNSLDESQSIFILSDIKTIFHLAKTFTEKSKLAYECTIKANTVRQAEKYSNDAEFAESVVLENLKLMEKEKLKKKYKYKIINSSSINNKELNEYDLFELKVDEWFKGKTFKQVIQNICEIINTEIVNNIISNLDKHKNIMKSYKELSLIFHPDKLNNNLNISEFDKFKYITMYKVMNSAKSIS